LKPHAPKLIPALLESLSVLEPQVLNYLSLRATDQEKAAMDSARLSAAKSSPMMETINMCLQYLDVSVLGELVPRLCELIRSGVGLGTKGGCASVIVSLTTQCPQDLTPHSGEFVRAACGDPSVWPCLCDRDFKKIKCHSDRLVIFCMVFLPVNSPFCLCFFVCKRCSDDQV